MIESIESITEQRMYHYLDPDMQQTIELLKDHFEALHRITPLTNNSTGYTQEVNRHAIGRRADCHEE